MDNNNSVNEDFKRGYVTALSDVFHVLIENMDDELKERILNDLKLKEYE